MFRNKPKKRENLFQREKSSLYFKAHLQLLLKMWPSQKHDTWPLPQNNSVIVTTEKSPSFKYERRKDSRIPIQEIVFQLTMGVF